MFDGEINYVFENLRLSPSTIGTRLRTLGASCGVHPLQGACAQTWGRGPATFSPRSVGQITWDGHWAVMGYTRFLKMATWYPQWHICLCVFTPFITTSIYLPQTQQLYNSKNAAPPFIKDHPLTSLAQGNRASSSQLIEKYETYVHSLNMCIQKKNMWNPQPKDFT